MIDTDETTQETVNTLEGLITILEDGKLGYIDAAEHVDNPAVKTDFLQYARERALFIVELQNQINKLGKSTDTAGGSTFGAIQRAWIDFKASFASDATESITNACISAEEDTIEKYKMVLEKNELDYNQITIVTKQLGSIENTLAKLKMKKNS